MNVDYNIDLIGLFRSVHAAICYPSSRARSGAFAVAGSGGICVV